jgi:iron complex outermembrane receptor protein
VFRISPQHILKAQYAQGFRPPTFFEFYVPRDPGAELDFEVNATTELGYVFRQPGRVVRATLFHSALEDMLFVLRGASSFGNVANARALGAELEWEQRLGSRVKASGNLSWVDTRDSRNGERIESESLAASDWLANLTLSARATRRLLVAARWSHVGDRVAPEVEGYDVVDLTLTRRDLFVDGLLFRAGVKNLLDDDVSYPVVMPNTALAAVFPGRSAWAELIWSR